MSREVMQKVLSSLMNLQPIIANGLLDKRQLAFIDPHLDMACEALIAELAKPDHIPDAGKMAGPERQPLTDEECIEAIDASFEFALASGNVSNASVIRYARVIEAKTKEQP